MLSLNADPSTRLLVASRSRRTSRCFRHAGSISSIRTCSFACSTGITRCVSGSTIVFGSCDDTSFSRGSYESTTFRPDDVAGVAAAAGASSVSMSTSICSVYSSPLCPRPTSASFSAEGSVYGNSLW